MLVAAALLVGSLPSPADQPWPTAVAVPATPTASRVGSAAGLPGSPLLGADGLLVPAPVGSGSTGIGVEAYPTPVPISTPVIVIPVIPTVPIAQPNLAAGASIGGCSGGFDPLAAPAVGFALGCPGGPAGLDLNGLGGGVPGLGVSQATNPAYAAYNQNLPPAFDWVQEEDEQGPEATDVGVGTPSQAAADVPSSATPASGITPRPAPPRQPTPSPGP